MLAGAAWRMSLEHEECTDITVQLAARIWGVVRWVEALQRPPQRRLIAFPYVASWSAFLRKPDVCQVGRVISFSARLSPNASP